MRRELTFKFRFRAESAGERTSSEEPILADAFCRLVDQISDRCNRALCVPHPRQFPVIAYAIAIPVSYRPAKRLDRAAAVTVSRQFNATNNLP